jgi:hypothetical protein
MFFIVDLGIYHRDSYIDIDSTVLLIRSYMLCVFTARSICIQVEVSAGTDTMNVLCDDRVLEI